MSRTYQATKYPLQGLTVGCDFSQSFIYYPNGLDQAAQNWTGYTGTAQLRSSPGAADSLLDFEVTLGSDGTVRLAADAAATAGLDPGSTVYDVKVTKAGDTKVLFAGHCPIAAPVTQ